MRLLFRPKSVVLAAFENHRRRDFEIVSNPLGDVGTIRIVLQIHIVVVRLCMRGCAVDTDPKRLLGDQ